MNLIISTVCVNKQHNLSHYYYYYFFFFWQNVSLCSIMWGNILNITYLIKKLI
jgi:hypothetical protein